MKIHMIMKIGRDARGAREPRHIDHGGAVATS
jgi:hypothetical protein